MKIGFQKGINLIFSKIKEKDNFVFFFTPLQKRVIYKLK